jgi:hypothetical protein
MVFSNGRSDTVQVTTPDWESGVHSLPIHLEKSWHHASDWCRVTFAYFVTQQSVI